MNRSEKLEKWCIDLDSSKIQLIVNLERSARLVAHVKQLTGDTDEKLVARLIEASEELRKSYEE